MPFDAENLLRHSFCKVVANVENDTLDFLNLDGSGVRFYHQENCCETVSIVDIVGDLKDLEGLPLVIAEEISSVDYPAPEPTPESYTWTFYRFATVKGTVTIRWLGESNGYYSESVAFMVLEPSEERRYTPEAPAFPDAERISKWNRLDLS